MQVARGMGSGVWGQGLESIYSYATGQMMVVTLPVEQRQHSHRGGGVKINKVVYVVCLVPSLQAMAFSISFWVKRIRETYFL